MKKILLILFSTILVNLNIFCVFSYKVETVNVGSNSDIVNEETSFEANNEESSFKDIIKKINEILWFIIGSIALGMVIYASYLLIASEWKDEDLKKANKTLVYWIVGIIIALLSKVIIKLVLNLF